MRNQNILNTFIEINPVSNDDFLKIRETLTRIGISSKRTSNSEKPTLWQSCHIFHKKGRYYIVHFKQMFLLDGKTANITVDDYDRLALVANLLEQWGLIKIKHNPYTTPNRKINVTIIPYAEKDEWNLKSKYTIGKKKSKRDEKFDD